MTANYVAGAPSWAVALSGGLQGLSQGYQQGASLGLDVQNALRQKMLQALQMDLARKSDARADRQSNASIANMENDNAMSLLKYEREGAQYQDEQAKDLLRWEAGAPLREAQVGASKQQTDYYKQRAAQEAAQFGQEQDSRGADARLLGTQLQGTPLGEKIGAGDPSDEAMQKWLGGLSDTAKKGLHSYLLAEQQRQERERFASGIQGAIERVSGMTTPGGRPALDPQIAQSIPAAIADGSMKPDEALRFLASSMEQHHRATAKEQEDADAHAQLTAMLGQMNAGDPRREKFRARLAAVDPAHGGWPDANSRRKDFQDISLAASGMGPQVIKLPGVPDFEDRNGLSFDVDWKDMTPAQEEDLKRLAEDSLNKREPVDWKLANDPQYNDPQTKAKRAERGIEFPDRQKLIRDEMQSIAKQLGMRNVGQLTIEERAQRLQALSRALLQSDEAFAAKMRELGITEADLSPEDLQIIQTAIAPYAGRKNAR